MKQLSRNAPGHLFILVWFVTPNRGILASWTPNAIKYTSPTKWLSRIPLYHFMI